MRRARGTWAGGETCPNLARSSTPIAPTTIVVTRVTVSAAFNERALVPNQACNVFKRMFVVMKDRAACPRLILIRGCCVNRSRHMDGDSCNELTQPTQLKLKETIHFRIDTVHTCFLIVNKSVARCGGAPNGTRMRRKRCVETKQMHRDRKHN